MAIDHEKLVKLLMLSTSSFDGEALSAIRKANAILIEEKTSWLQYFQQIRAQQSQRNHTHQRPPENDYDKVARAFEILDKEIKAEHPTSFQSFLQSLHNQWERRGSLSPKQRSALYKAAGI